MSRSFGLVDYKVLEAEYFLDQLIACSGALSISGAQYNASAFAAAARSITFAMQASMSDADGFRTWWTARQTELRAEPLARFFNDFRRVTQHIGLSVVNAGSARDGRATYYFQPCGDLPHVPSQDVEAACEEYFGRILDLVYRCYVDFRPLVDGQAYFTESNFRRLGLTIEDAEAQLGLAHGWTSIGDPELSPQRWAQLRRMADGCLIEQQFDRWLGRVLPPVVDA